MCRVFDVSGSLSLPGIPKAQGRQEHHQSRGILRLVGLRSKTSLVTRPHDLVLLAYRSIENSGEYPAVFMGSDVPRAPAAGTFWLAYARGFHEKAGLSQGNNFPLGEGLES